MKFEKYTSIENSYREKFVSACVNSILGGYCDDDFVVEEKAHGANFAFYYDGTELKTASRTAFLAGDGDSFSKSNNIKERYAEAIKTLYSLLGYDSGGGGGDGDGGSGRNKKTIQVVGELIGGSYEHPDVERNHQLPKIQKGVDYCPGHEFYAFDLHVLSPDGDHEDGEEARYRTTVDKLEMNSLFKEAGLFYAKPLFRGTLHECLAFDNTFKSHIPGWLGLPEHPAVNTAEGKVIKPVRVATLANGSRIILKDKAKAFTEVHEVRPSEKKSSKKAAATAAVALSGRGVELADILRAHITTNRLSNVLSKLPDRESVTVKDFNRIVGLFSRDAFDEFEKDYAGDFAALNPKEKKLVKKRFGSEAAALIRSSLPQK